MNNKYRKGNPKLKEGQVYRRNKDSNFLIKLRRYKYSRWECSVISGEPPSKGQYASIYNNLGDGPQYTYRTDPYTDEKGRKLVIYSAANISQNFKYDPIGSKLYG